MQEVIAHRGKTSRNAECTPGYYNFEGEFNRRQDGNYNGGFPKYYDHLGRRAGADRTALRVHAVARQRFGQSGSRSVGHPGPPPGARTDEQIQQLTDRALA